MKTCMAYDLMTLSQRTQDPVTKWVTAPGVIAVGGNVQQYRARELDLPGLPPETIVRLYRPVDEVAKSAASYEGTTLAFPHPGNKVLDADNWPEFAAGDTCDVHMVGDQMHAKLVFKKKAAIDALMSGVDALSTGYKFQFDDSVRATPDGTPVDGYMRNIVANHTALVPRGRGGPECRVLDHGEPDKNQKPKEKRMRSIKVGKTPLDLEEPQASIVEALAIDHGETVVKLAEANAALATQKTANDAALGAKDVIVAAKDAEISALKAAQKEAGDQEKLAIDHAACITDAAVLAPEVKPAGLSIGALRKAALTSACAKKENATIKTVVDAALCGSTIDKAEDAILASTFSTAVALMRGQKAEKDKAAASAIAADGLVPALLGAGGDPAPKPASKSDGSDLSGYDLYCWNLTHPKSAAKNAA